jgi:hypothetical protein
MTQSGDWLADVTIVNESGAPDDPGDVSIFRSAAEACRYLEHWWVEENEGTARNGRGDRVVLGVEGRKVVVQAIAADPNGSSILLVWLRHAAKALLDARQQKARRNRGLLSRSEQLGVLPETVEGLIAYIGFDT